MKLGVVGSRGIIGVTLDEYITDDVAEIVTGGAVGVDTCAAEYAERMGLRLTVFLPEYKRYGRAAPIVRNKKIVDYADKIIAIWNGKSRGTRSVINYAKKAEKPCVVVIRKNS